MKKLINDPRNVVRELLEGLVDLSPGLALLVDENVVIRADIGPIARRPVAVISGGGSGHEPAHAGYVGHGFLSAAVAGDVFTSPSSDAVLAAIEAVAGPAGALLVVKNYTGDRLNFGLAGELARQRGIPTELVFVADDVALRGIVPDARRRGIAGAVLINKIAGAAAARGMALAQVAQIARTASANLGSMGVGLGSCIVPSAATPGFELGPDEIELGLGIHGEKGVERTEMRSADAIVDSLLDAILSDREFGPGTRIALLVNGLGGTSAMELAIVARRALAELRRRGMNVGRAWCGNYLSAMEMPGVSLSLLRLDADREALLADPTDAPAWAATGIVPLVRQLVPTAKPKPPPSDAASPGPLSGILTAVAEAVAAGLDFAEPKLTELDGAAGDGDLGASMRRGASAIRALPQSAYDTPTTFLNALAEALRKAVAGSSGPFYATALLRASSRLTGKSEPKAEEWLEAFAAAIESISELGGAKAGDRTMLDALAPAISAWRASLAAGQTAIVQIRSMADAAEAGARETAAMIPVMGRASYLGRRALGVPDAGATAVALWLEAIADEIETLKR